MSQNTTIIEINGMKLEVDLRQAKRIETLKVGSPVKVLAKGYDGYKVHAGTVVGFEPFASLPTIIVAYLDIDYVSADLKFIHFNAQSKDIEIVHSVDGDLVDIDRGSIVDRMDREIAKKELELEELHARKAFFLANFGKYFPQFADV